MTKEIMIHNLRKIIDNLPNIIYAYVGGSFNTPFRTQASDIDLILVWRERPLHRDRNEILNRILTTFNAAKEWSFFDAEDEIVRDAIKLQNLSKIEIYHHSFIAFEYALQNLLQEDGFVYSISNRVPLVSRPDIETFVESYLPSKINIRQDFLFTIMANYQAKSLDESTLKNIIGLYSIYKYGGVPSSKHQSRIIIDIPKNELLMDGRLAEWISLSLELLFSWGEISPDTQLLSKDFFLEKQNSKTTLQVYEKIIEQKERLAAHLSWPGKIQSLKDQEEFSLRANSQWSKGQAFHFQIFYQKQFVGAISIHTLNYLDRSFEFGYWIDQNSEGKGLITQGLKLLLPEMQGKGWRKAKIRTAKENIKSRSVAERLKMEVETTSETSVMYSLGL